MRSWFSSRYSLSEYKTDGVLKYNNIVSFKTPTFTISILRMLSCPRCVWRSQWPHSLRRGSAVARLPGLWIRIPPANGCLSLVIVACRQAEICALDWSLVQRSPTVCAVSECQSEASIMRRPWPTRGCCAMAKKKKHCVRKTGEGNYPKYQWTLTVTKFAIPHRQQQYIVIVKYAYIFTLQQSTRTRHLIHCASVTDS